jgi:hypothetical protein
MSPLFCRRLKRLCEYWVLVSAQDQVTEGWAVGRIYPGDVTLEPTRGVVLKTTDGGGHWQEIPVSQDELFYTQVQICECARWLVNWTE